MDWRKQEKQKSQTQN